MLIKTNNREEAYKAVINTWLKASPDNVDYCMAVINQNKLRKGSMLNCFGASKENPDDFRIGLSLPIDLYYVLNDYEKMHGQKFMDSKADLRWFARKFPQFCIIEKI